MEVFAKGRFTAWTVKLDPGRWPFSKVGLDDPTPMVQFLKIKNKKNKKSKHLGP